MELVVYQRGQIKLEKRLAEMSNPKRGTTFLTEFKEFISFLQNLWGILAGLSVFFPLSNVLTKFVPLKTFDQDGAFVYLSPYLITTLSTLAILFFVLFTFSNRNKFKIKQNRPRIQRQALISFVTGVLALLIYVSGYYVKLLYAYSVWGWESDAPHHLLAEVPLLVIYVLSFVLITRAFMLLGMIEFFSMKRVN